MQEVTKTKKKASDYTEIIRIEQAKKKASEFLKWCYNGLKNLEWNG